MVQYPPGHEGRAGTCTQAECHPGPRHFCLLTREEGSRQRGACKADGAQPEAGATDAKSLRRPLGRFSVSEFAFLIAVTPNPSSFKQNNN